MGMNLTQSQEVVVWPETHYVFVERHGPFMPNAQQAWMEMHRLLPEVAAGNEIRAFFSLYRMHPPVYRAGVSVAAKPASLPAGLRYELFEGGRYERFTLVGPYSQLPEASGKVWEAGAEQKLALREGFAIEHYVNNPQTAAEADLITEILLPVE